MSDSETIHVGHSSGWGFPKGLWGDLAKIGLVGVIVFALILQQFQLLADLRDYGREHAQRIERAVEKLDTSVQSLTGELRKWRQP